MDRAQMLKGVLEGCILKIISGEETYGYKITEDMNKLGFRNLNEGSVYPVLMRMEKKGLLISMKKVSPLGPKRKYFSLSKDGMEYLRNFQDLWTEVSSAVETVMSSGGSDELQRKE